MVTVIDYLRRGLIAGGAGGLVTGLFAYLVAEPAMNRAVDLEDQRSAAEEAAALAAGHPMEQHAEVFTRSEQHLGLVVAMLVTGVAIGALLALVYAAVYRRDPERDAWGRSLRLTGAAFLGFVILPFLRYPPNPPGVGDPATVGMRSSAWMAAILLGVLTAAAAWILNGRLAERGTPVPVRQVAVVALPLAVLAGMLLLMPDNPDPLPVPADLLWQFRVSALASSALLWATIAVVFGALGYRAERSRAIPVVRAELDRPAMTA